MSKIIWYSIIIYYLFLFDGTLSSSMVKVDHETEAPETTGAPSSNATIEHISLLEISTTQQPATGEIPDGKHENPELPLSPSESLEKPLPQKRGVLDSLYQPGNFEETGYDANEDAGSDESFSASKSDFEEKPFYKYGDAAFVPDDGYFENEERTKRTADSDEIYNEEPVREIELTVDELVGLLEYLENRFAEEERENYRPLPDIDNNIEAIQEDMKEGANDRDGGKYDHMIASYLAHARGINAGRVRKNSIYDQRPNTPTYRRLIF